MKKIYRGYQYLFYKFYAWDLWLHGEKDFPYQAAWFTLSFLIYMNFVFLMAVSEVITGYGFEQFMSLSNLNKIAIGTGFLIFNYFLFVRKRKYKKIVKQFENEDRKSRIIGNIFAWGYVFLTLPGFFFLCYLFSIIRPHH